MIRVSIIGSGNVAQHLIKVFSLNTDIELVQIFVRNKKTFLERGFNPLLSFTSFYLYFLHFLLFTYTLMK